MALELASNSSPSPLFLSIAAHALILLARFVAHISTCSSILVPRMCVLYHTFIAYSLVMSL
jgi:Na+/alanine symporter